MDIYRLTDKSWTPQSISQELVDAVAKGDVEHLLIAVRLKDGTLDTAASYMPLADLALLVKVTERRMLRELDKAADDQ